MPKADHPIAPEVRAVESQIDQAHLKNDLTKKRFAEAAWRFLAFCEELFLRPFVQVDLGNPPPSAHTKRALADSVLNHARWPLHWLARSCSAGGIIPKKYDADAYDASWQLSRLARDYNSFVSAYVWANLGVIRLRLTDTTLLPDPSLTDDGRYEAYDRLVDLSANSRVAGNADELFDRIDASIRLRGERFSYDSSSRLVHLGMNSLTFPLGPEPALPASWKFSRYSVGEFQRLARVLTIICLMHFRARLGAAQMGLPGCGYADSLLVFDSRTLHRRLVILSDLPHNTVAALLEDLTYGAREMRNPDPALQPLIPLRPKTYAIAPNVIINSSLERNFAVLMNRIREEREIYSRLNSERESLSRSRIIEAITSLPIQHWHGNVPGWSQGREIDLVLMEESSKSCLVLELKSFVAPADIREIQARSEEIAKGISQIRVRQELASATVSGFHRVLGIDGTWSISWAVASETSVGAVFVQAEDIAVVRTGHLIRKILDNEGLAGIGDWLRNRDYLPVEGRDFRIVDTKPTVAGWSLKWYGLEMLREEL